jgi:hypothetical protein
MTISLRLVSLLVVTTCGCPQPGPSDGEEGGACFGNGTCNDALACVNGTCVEPLAPAEGEGEGEGEGDACRTLVGSITV